MLRTTWQPHLNAVIIQTSFQESVKTLAKPCIITAQINFLKKAKYIIK